MLASREMALRLRDFDTDAQESMKYWNRYPVGSYTHLARPQNTWNELVGEAFCHPVRLSRSASIAALRPIPDYRSSTYNLYDPEYGLRRSASMSEVFDYRPTRRSESYADLRTRRARSATPARMAPYDWTMFEPSRPSQPLQTHSYVSSYVNKIKNIYSTPPLHQSYVSQSEKYVHDYKVSQNYMPGTYVPYVYSPRDYGRRDRRFMGRSALYISVPTGLPRYSYRAWHPRSVYRLNERYYNHRLYPFSPRLAMGPARLGSFYWARNPAPWEWDNIDLHPVFKIHLHRSLR